MYFCFLSIDCFLLYHGNYGYRLYVKPALMPLLLLWFMSNTAFNIRSSTKTFASRLLVYFILACTFASDVCGLFADKLIWLACLSLYSFSYILYIFLVISVQKNASEEKRFFIYIKKFLPTFLSTLSLGIVFLRMILHIGISFSNLFFYIHAFCIAFLSGLVANLWGVEQLKEVRLLFAIGVFFLIITNIIYSIDELIYHRGIHIIDVIVACNNGLSQIFMLLGVIKMIRFKRE